MRADADTAMIESAAGPDRSHMGAGMDATITHACAGTHNRAGMAARRHAVMVDACARADAADMGTRSDTIAADMGADTNTQDLDICAHG
jgi:hypothetical protein